MEFRDRLPSSQLPRCRGTVPITRSRQSPRLVYRDHCSASPMASTQLEAEKPSLGGSSDLPRRRWRVNYAKDPKQQASGPSARDAKTHLSPVPCQFGRLPDAPILKQKSRDVKPGVVDRLFVFWKNCAGFSRVRQNTGVACREGGAPAGGHRRRSAESRHPLIAVQWGEGTNRGFGCNLVRLESPGAQGLGSQFASLVRREERQQRVSGAPNRGSARPVKRSSEHGFRDMQDIAMFGCS